MQGHVAGAAGERCAQLAQLEFLCQRQHGLAGRPSRGLPATAGAASALQVPQQRARRRPRGSNLLFHRPTVPMLLLREACSPCCLWPGRQLPLLPCISLFSALLINKHACGKQSKVSSSGRAVATGWTAGWGLLCAAPRFPSSYREFRKAIASAQDANRPKAVKIVLPPTSFILL